MNRQDPRPDPASAPDSDGTVDADDTDDTGARERARRRRLDEVFGDVVPEEVRDDADAARRSGGSTDDWLRDQVPPHHG